MTFVVRHLGREHEILRAPVDQFRSMEAMTAGSLAECVERCGRTAADQAERVAGSWGGGPAAIRRRCDEAAETARVFLAAEDTEPAERARVKRVRAGLLFIESYRDLPL